MGSRGGWGRGARGEPPTHTALSLPRALCRAGTASSCVSWPSRTPIGSGRAGRAIAAGGGLGLTGAEWRKRRSPLGHLDPSTGVGRPEGMLVPCRQ